MTTLVEDIQAIVNPLATGGAWYAVNTSNPPVYPYITVTRINSTFNVTLQGPSSLQNTVVQFDIYARRQSEAMALEQSINAALLDCGITNIPMSSTDMYEEPVRAFRISLDYSFWATN